MVAPNLKTETLLLIEKRRSIESQMDVIVERLRQMSDTALSGDLVDSEGFPRSDIDIPTVLLARRQLGELKTDHMEITEQINQNIQILHSANPTTCSSLRTYAGVTVGSNGARSRASAVASSSSNSILQSNFNSAMITNANVGIPFALVHEITAGSPAAVDGMQIGDRIIKLGSVEACDDPMPRVVSELNAHVNRPMPIVVLRNGTLVNLTVTPRSLEGGTLIGCHFRLL